MKINNIITHSTNYYPLLLKLTENSNNLTTKISSIDSFFNTFTSIKKDKLQSFYDCYTNINKVKDNYPLLKTALSSISFCETVFNFLYKCQQYNVDLNTLKPKTPFNKSMVELLKELNNTSYINEYNFKDINNYSFCLYNYENYYQYLLFKSLINNKLITNPITVNNNNPVIDYYYSLTTNQLIESIALYIINNNIKANQVNLIVTNNSILNDLYAIFSQYNIPLNIQNNSIYNKELTLFKLILNYFKTKDITYLVQAIINGLYIEDIDIPTNQLYLYQQYIKEYNQPLLDADNALFEKNNEAKIFNNCINLVNKYVDYINELYPVISNNQQVIHASFNILNSYCSLTDNYVLDYISNIYTTLYQDINDQQVYDLFIYKLNIDNNYRNVISYDGAIVTNLTKPVNPLPYSFIININSKEYPGFKPLDGLFDEQFVANSNYPSLQERQQFYQSQIQWIKNSGDNIFYCYAFNGNDSKGYDLPLEFNINDFKQFEPIKTNTYKPFNTTLDEPLDKVSNKGIIYSSVSSLEVFTNCPFSYYLAKVLKVYQPQQLFSAATLGSIIHDCLKEGIGNNLFNEKDNTKVLTQLLNERKEVLKPFFVQRENLLDAMIEKSIVNLNTVTINLVNNKQLDTNAKDLEKQIEYEIIKFHIKGAIDRLDTNGVDFGIIDYKSSSHSLSATKMSKGLQLQLLTYAYIYKELTHYNLQYLLYVNFNIVANKIQPYSILKSGLKYVEEDKIKNNALEIKGYKNSKIGNKTTNNETLYEGIEVIYQQLYQEITSGDFAINPIKDGCTFCQYHSICRNKKEGVDRDIIFEFAPKGEKNEVE